MDRAEVIAERREAYRNAAIDGRRARSNDLEILDAIDAELSAFMERLATLAGQVSTADVYGAWEDFRDLVNDGWGDTFGAARLKVEAME
ncbi:hypothetical protein L2U69_11975 [Zavarzinia compransoris]|uniref:hypothetical protein n=1 Tax=Zavarzinia marina TaxID=2911065 RepID=UPI001F1D5944|nr:hypothetical protein [Zavarzinia marina]MCF4166364.1 hypothetical protein [Zavarzinia marina]